MDTAHFGQKAVTPEPPRMMPAGARLFDRAMLAANAKRARALASARPGADFLFQRAREDLVLRLSDVSRPFPLAVDLGSPSAGLAAEIAAPGRLVVRASALWDAVPGPLAIASGLDALPFAPGSVDLVVSVLALQWSEDLPGLLAQIRGALRPDGLFLAGLIGGRSLHELRTAFAQAEAETTGGASPRVIPFVELRDAGALLQRAGFALPVADTDTLIARYDSLLDLAADLRAMGAANPLRERSRKPLKRATLLRAAQIYAERFADPDGRVRATFELVWLSGWAPHESQQKPLRPGSAKQSLAEALGRREDDKAIKPGPLPPEGDR